ncbi:MAG: HU family DNA-binding protein [bacterium]|jgi:DNA-binding protein HU-beta|nr:HU family DNA-binding protein [bacterium]
MAEDKKNKVGKAEIVADFAAEAKLNKKEAGELVSTLLKVIVNRLKKGENVRLIPFGAFEIRERKARKGRRPGASGDAKEIIDIPARRVPVFRPGKELKEAVK